MQEQKICPYPGLRPFNEEESIFFRGREEHIEKIIGQLEEKKFVMLTGASGDGKSSLIYAGVIPNARAGFFKAKFNNWLIADFRPERTPLKNLAVSLATKLNLEKATVESELSFGFSSLVNLYKKSASHLDYNAPNYTNAEEADKKKLKRKAANLFILVDQFEEFFTNPENYKNGQASNESQLVVNLLLETARIALAEDLPIYIVCTMRSDYIGQCAAFRGLPEYIGYSQFFVPRLKRKEIHQVISEPAMLSGNSISSRLVETLINEIGDGFDQLPVLQHALNRIWNKTNKGQYEMDLLHLAMVGGLAPSQLPENDRAIFDGWFASVAENKKLFFKKPSLDAVLNAHAQELYESAHEYYNEQHSEKIVKGEAQLIIKTAFQCLTKIDESRAVRNRMSLQEITNIIHDSSISVEKVDAVLRIFRLQGNTFIKPFATIDTANENLAAETVLDITHESLIRNWDLLEQWAKEEQENRLTFEDFYKQLQRWIDNDKASGFLLPIGPLTFFEQWFTTCNPNKYWLARYDSSNLSKTDKLKKADETLNAAKEFIGSSARNLFFSRTVLKYGAGKIIALVGMLLLLFACTYYYLDFKKKQNVAVLERINTRAIDLLGSPDVSVSYKADFLINAERLNESKGNNSFTTFENLLNGINNDSMAFDIAYSMLNQCKTIQGDDSLAYDKQGILSMKVFTYLFHRFENDANSQVLDSSKKKNVSIKLERINKFLGLCALMKNSYTQRDSAAVETICSKAIWLTKNLLLTTLKLVEEKRKIRLNSELFNNCIVTLLAIDDKPNYRDLITYFESNNDTIPSTLEPFYEDNSYQLSCVKLGNGFNEILAMLYSSEYDNDTSVLNKIIELVNQNKFELPDYVPINIFNCLVRHSVKPIDNFSQILKTHSQNYDLGYSPLVNPILELILNSNNDLSKMSNNQKSIKNYCDYFISPNRKEDLWNYYFKSITNKSFEFSSQHAPLDSYSNLNDNLKLDIANYFKLRAFYFSKSNDIEMMEINFNKMIQCYRTVNASYLNKTNLTGIYSPQNDIENFNYILYPKICLLQWTYSFDCSGKTIYEYNSNEAYQINQSQCFINFVIKNKHADFTSNFIQSSLLYLELNEGKNWKYFSGLILEFEKKKRFKTVHKVVNSVAYTATAYNINSIVVCPLIEIILDLEKGDTISAINRYRSSKMELTDLNFKGNLINTLKKEAIIQFAVNGCFKESLELLSLLKEHYEKQNLLIEICYTLQTEGPIENTYIYLDKLLEGATRETGTGSGLFRILGKIGGKEINGIAQTKLRKTPELLKPKALQNLIKGIAERGNYYEALQYLPDYISSSKELSLYNEILKAEIIKRENKNAKNATSGNWNDAAFFKLDLSTEGTSLGNVSLD